MVTLYQFDKKTSLLFCVNYIKEAIPYSQKGIENSNQKNSCDLILFNDTLHITHSLKVKFIDSIII